MTVNFTKPFLGVLGAALVALMFAAPNAIAGTSQPTSISSDTAQVVTGDAALVGDDQPTPPPSDQTKPKKGKHKGKGKGKGKGKPKSTTPPTTEGAPKSGQ